MKQEKNKNLKFGFTLLELLVVVLIIGILASIALPQYKKAVLRSKLSTIKDMTRAIYNAEQRYYLLNNQYTTKFRDLDITISNPDCVLTSVNSYILCNLKDKKGNLLIQYIIWTENGKRGCDAFPGDKTSLTNQICQIDTKKQPPSSCGSFCRYYY